MLGEVQPGSTIECILCAFYVNDTRVRCVREVYWPYLCKIMRVYL